MKRNKAVFIISLGCAKNLVDTEVMCGALVTAGYYIASSEKDADICLINTCGFIRDARDESFGQIQWAVEWKGRSRRMIVVAGCLAQRNPGLVLERFPQVDLVIGLDDVARLPELIAAREAGERRSFVGNGLPEYLYDDRSPRVTLTPGAYAYVKIAEGCDHGCSYCAIPLIRGRQRSRSQDSVLNECRQLLGQGAFELDFIAQDSSRYGADLSPAGNLEQLLRKCDALDGDFWIRVLYTHPLHITEGLLDVLDGSRHVVPYLDIPLQHVSSRILSDMRRGMDGPETRRLLREIRLRHPGMAIRTTFLVGYPGETEDDFRELLDFVREFRFDRLGVFAFSPEENTPAARAAGEPVPEELALERRGILLEEQQSISLENNRRLVGTGMRVLLERQVSKRKWEARSMADAPEVDQVVTVRGGSSLRPGFADVLVSGASEYMLEARLDGAKGR